MTIALPLLLHQYAKDKEVPERAEVRVPHAEGEARAQVAGFAGQAEVVLREGGEGGEVALSKDAQERVPGEEQAEAHD